MAQQTAGVLICLGGSFLTACSNIILKYADIKNSERLHEGLEPLESVNSYCIIRYVTMIGGALGDLTSMSLLPYGAWAGLNVSNLVFYLIMAHFFINDPLELPEAGVLVVITISVVGCAVTGPVPEEKGISAMDEIIDMDWQQFDVVFPIVALSWLAMFYLQRKNHKVYTQLKETDPVNYPPEWMPDPISPYNFSGPYCASIVTCFAQVAIKCTVGSLDPPEWILVFPILGIIILYPWHLYNLNFMAEQLHAVTCTPVHIMLTMLWNSLFGFLFFESKPLYPFMYITSCHCMILAIILYVIVEDILYARDKTTTGGMEDVRLLDHSAPKKSDSGDAEDLKENEEPVSDKSPLLYN